MTKNQWTQFQEVVDYLAKTAQPPHSFLPVLLESLRETLLKRGLPLMPEQQDIADLDALTKTLAADHISIRAEIDCSTALLFQEKTGSEISFDRVTCVATRSVFTLVTRGGEGVTASDHLFYYTFSPDFLIQPIFHTHPECSNELGRYMPSKADFRSLYLLTMIQKIQHAQDTVLFPDGSSVRYGVGNDGIPLLDTMQSMPAERS